MSNNFVKFIIKCSNLNVNNGNINDGSINDVIINNSSINNKIIINNKFFFYIFNNCKNINYIENSDILLKLQRIANIENMYDSLYNMKSRLDIKNGSSMIHNVHQNKIYKLVDYMTNMMEIHNINIDFNIYKYDLYESYNINNMYFIIISIKNIKSKKIYDIYKSIYEEDIMPSEYVDIESPKTLLIFHNNLFFIYFV